MYIIQFHFSAAAERFDLGLGSTISSLWRVPQFEFRAGAQTQRTILMARNTKSSPCFSINLQADRGDELKLCGWKRMLSTVVNSPFKLLCGPYKEIYTVNLHQNLADERGQHVRKNGSMFLGLCPFLSTGASSVWPSCSLNAAAI